MISDPEYKRGDIWIVNLDPTIGSEIKKSRPAVIVSSDALGILPLKQIAPFTTFKPHFEDNIWHIKILPDKMNGLKVISAVDVLQCRCVDIRRFISKIGTLSSSQMKEIALAIAAIVEVEI